MPTAVARKDKKRKKKDGQWPPKKQTALSKADYEKELRRLQVELVQLEEWVRHRGLRVVVLFEGRDTAGKGGVIKRMTALLNPRFVRVVALPAPTERERTQWYFQRYVTHLPAAGEMALLDRSWYNRAGVERVMGFCTQAEYDVFMRSCPALERMLINSGLNLISHLLSLMPYQSVPQEQIKLPPRQERSYVRPPKSAQGTPVPDRYQVE